MGSAGRLMTLPGLTFVKPYAVMLPDDPHVTRSRLIKHSLQFDIAVALTRPMTATGVDACRHDRTRRAVGAQSLRDQSRNDVRVCL